MDILLIEEDKKVAEYCKNYLEEKVSSIKIDIESKSDDIKNKIEADDYNGIIFDLSKDGYDESDLYENVKNNDSKLNFILSINKKNKTGSVKITYYNKLKKRAELKNDLKEGYGLIEAFLDSGKNESKKEDKKLDLEETIQLLYDNYVKYIFDKTIEQDINGRKIVEDNIPIVVFYRRVKKLKNLGLVESNKKRKSLVKSYKTNLENCRLSCKDGIISAEFDLNGNINNIYNDIKPN